MRPAFIERTALVVQILEGLAFTDGHASGVQIPEPFQEHFRGYAEIDDFGNAPRSLTGK